MRAALTLLFAVVTLASVHAQALVPVMVGDGLDQPYDACSSLGRVTGLNPAGDNFLAVRGGPSTDFVKLDEVYTDNLVMVCEERSGWFGIVYERGGGGPERCGVGQPLERQAYRGPCRSGWVFGRYVEIIAG